MMKMQSTIQIGDLHDLLGNKVAMLVAKRTLPEVVGFLIKRRGAEQAEKDLREIGSAIAHRILTVWQPKNIDPYRLFKEAMSKFFGNKKIKEKVLEKMDGKPTKISIQDHNCPLCPEKKRE
jgi:hypothetical protein